MATEELSLRERKKRRTRRELMEAAARLFSQQGYEETTLEQICEEVELSVPTLLAYFPSKDRLALAAEWDMAARLRSRLSDPDREQDTLSIWREFVQSGAAWAVKHRKAYIKGAKDFRESPTLRKAQLELLAELQDILEAGLAADYGTDADADLPTRLLATMLAFGNQTVADHWIDSDGKGDLEEQTIAVVDFAIEQFPKPGSGEFAGSAGRRSPRRR